MEWAGGRADDYENDAMSAIFACPVVEHGDALVLLGRGLVPPENGIGVSRFVGTEVEGKMMAQYQEINQKGGHGRRSYRKLSFLSARSLNPMLTMALLVDYQPDLCRDEIRFL